VCCSVLQSVSIKDSLEANRDDRYFGLNPLWSTLRENERDCERARKREQESDGEQASERVSE